MTVSMVVIEQDNLKRLGVPENCKQGSYVPSTQENQVIEPTIPTEPTEPVEGTEEPKAESLEESETEVPTEPTEPEETTESTATLPPLA